MTRLAGEELELTLLLGFSQLASEDDGLRDNFVSIGLRLRRGK